MISRDYTAISAIAVLHKIPVQTHGCTQQRILYIPRSLSTIYIPESLSTIYIPESLSTIYSWITVNYIIPESLSTIYSWITVNYIIPESLSTIIFLNHCQLYIFESLSNCVQYISPKWCGCPRKILHNILCIADTSQAAASCIHTAAVSCTD